VTILALDIGSKKTGVAISHGEMAQALITIFIDKTGEKGLIEKINKIISDQKVEQLVVGMPLSKDGHQTTQSALIKGQAQRISSAVSLPVEFCEETLTSWEAEEQIGKNRDQIDAQAAKIILEQYLNERRR